MAAISEITEAISGNSSSVGIQTALGRKVAPESEEDEVFIKDGSSSKSDSSESDDGEQAVALLMVAEIQEKLCAAMHHYNQHRRLDTKVVAKYAYQLYRLISCIAWLVLPTVATVLVSFITDQILGPNTELRMYKNCGLIAANCFLWMFGLYNLGMIWKDLRQCSNDLQCLSDKRWMYEEEFINNMLCRGLMAGNDVMENEEKKVAEKDVGEPEMEEGITKGAAIEEIETGAAGDILQMTAKDKDV